MATGIKNPPANQAASGKSTSQPLSRSAHDLERLSHALRAVAAEVPGRSSVRQAMAFMTVAYVNAMGSTVTMSELKELVGDDTAGQPLMGVATERTLNTFLEPTKREPDALGWIVQVPDEDDRRRKFLKLSPVGAAAAQRFIEAFAATKE